MFVQDSETGNFREVLIGLAVRPASLYLEMSHIVSAGRSIHHDLETSC